MYSLTKMSAPGFQLHSESIDNICGVLEGYMCSDCINGENYDQHSELTTREQVENLLFTACGAEFIFDECVRDVVEDPYVRKWECNEQHNGYVVSLSVGNCYKHELITKEHWENALYPVDVLRCTVGRLQRKVFSNIFPTHRGRFCCDWVY